MTELKLRYSFPQLVYLDINSDIKMKQYIAWKKSMIRIGWEIKETDD